MAPRRPRGWGREHAFFELTAKQLANRIEVRCHVFFDS